MLSPPFMCCSSGVATDCSMVTASAPVYVAETMICGCTIPGSCARGRTPRALAPPRPEQRALLASGHRPHPAILARAQHIPRVREQSGQPDRTRLRIYLTVRNEECPFVRIRGPVGQDQLQFEALRCCETLCSSGIPP